MNIHGPKDAAALGIEVVYQDLALADNLDVVQNMYLGREELGTLRRLDETAMEKRASETLKGLSVTTIRSVRQTVAGLSGGQRQSVAVAKAVMWNSRVVILDEPTAALGVAQTKQVLDLVARLGEQGLAVVLISHNLHDIFQVADIDHGAAARPEREGVQAPRDQPAGGRRGDHRRPALAGPRPVRGGRRMSAATAPPPAAEPGAPAANTVGAYAQRWWTDVKSGELGSLPIVVGLIIIAIIFQTQNDRFLTASNFVNLIVQTAPYAVIAMGVTFALLLGEIDLSIGFVSGVGGVLTAILLTPDGSVPPTWLVIVIVLGAGLGIGTFHGLIITKVGVPSFVVTLAGLLAWNGVVLLLIGSKGTVILQNDFVIGLANNFMKTGDGLDPHARLPRDLRGAAAHEPALAQGRRARHRSAADRGAADRRARGSRWRSSSACNQDRGVPYALLIVGGLFVLWTYVLNRTKFGRHIYAVGGNAEAARRAGINVDNVRIACFAIVSMMAVIGGILLASRLRSVDTNTGGGQALLYPIAAAVIGGTSLFGGRGTMKAALLGALVMLGIDNGLGLLGLSSGTKFVLTGGVLLLAVTVDSISRRGREASGRA